MAESRNTTTIFWEHRPGGTFSSITVLPRQASDYAPRLDLGIDRQLEDTCDWLANLSTKGQASRERLRLVLKGPVTQSIACVA